MCLSRDPLFCIGLLPNASLVHNFTPNDPYFCFFNWNFRWNHQILNNFANCRENLKNKIFKFPRLCVISHPMTPLFQICYPMTAQPLYPKFMHSVGLWDLVSAGRVYHWQNLVSDHSMSLTEWSLPGWQSLNLHPRAISHSLINLSRILFHDWTKRCAWSNSQWTCSSPFRRPKDI